MGQREADRSDPASHVDDHALGLGLGAVENSKQSTGRRVARTEPEAAAESSVDSPIEAELAS